MATKDLVKIVMCKLNNYKHEYHTEQPSVYESLFWSPTKPKQPNTWTDTESPQQDMHALQFRVVLPIQLTCSGKSTWLALCQLHMQRRSSRSPFRFKILTREKQIYIPYILAQMKGHNSSQSLQLNMRISHSACSTR